MKITTTSPQFTNTCDKCSRKFESINQFATRCSYCLNPYKAEYAIFQRLKKQLPFKNYANFIEAVGYKPEGMSLQKLDGKWRWHPYAGWTREMGIKKSGDIFIAYARNKKVGEYTDMAKALAAREKALLINPLLGY